MALQSEVWRSTSAKKQRQKLKVQACFTAFVKITCILQILSSWEVLVFLIETCDIWLRFSAQTFHLCPKREAKKEKTLLLFHKQHVSVCCIHQCILVMSLFCGQLQFSFTQNQLVFIEAGNVFRYRWRNTSVDEFSLLTVFSAAFLLFSTHIHYQKLYVQKLFTNWWAKWLFY